MYVYVSNINCKINILRKKKEIQRLYIYKYKKNIDIHIYILYIAIIATVSCRTVSRVHI